MAVKRSKMITRFKELFPKVNLSKTRLNMLMDKLKSKPADDAEDSAIDEILNDFDGIYPFSEIAKDDDKARKLESDKAALEAKAKRKKGKSDDEDDDPDDDSEDGLGDDAPDWAKKMFKQNKSLAKSNETLKGELESIKSGSTTESRNQQVKDLFTESEVLKGLAPGIQDRLMKTIDFESEESPEDQIVSLEEDYKGMVQHNADNTNYSGPPGSGSPDVEVDAKKVDAVLDNMNI